MSYGVRLCSFVDAEGVSPCGKYRWEFSEWLGPTFLTPKTGEVMKNQPVDENWPGWKPFEEWLAAYRSGLGKTVSQEKP